MSGILTPGAVDGQGDPAPFVPRLPRGDASTPRRLRPGVPGDLRGTKMVLSGW
jgi:hypothetical protein